MFFQNAFRARVRWSLCAALYKVSKQPILSGGGSLQENTRTTGLPLGNLTSQLFANTYLDGFDHYMKDELRTRQYIRYTDDIAIVHHDPAHLAALLQRAKEWLWRERRLTVHPRKQEVRNVNQGVDFLGYVTMPHHRVLRTKTKRRMLKRVTEDNVASYSGLLEHCHGHSLQAVLRQSIRKTPR